MYSKASKSRIRAGVLIALIDSPTLATGGGVSCLVLLLLLLLLVLFGLGAMIEMVYHLQLQITVDGAMVFLGVPLQTDHPLTWIGCGAAVAVGGLIWRPCQQRFSVLWNQIREFVPLPDDLPYGEPLAA